ncbi:peptide chain release factor N(5)-glutamine methyltransferase [Pelagibacteraceae bacterium]|nr:peptide chain release factor N(5)-glutamine methyltransferase [Pelagibacteraceae bacterium]
MTTINEILYTNYLDIHILEKKILLSNLLNTSKEELNLATQNKLSDNIIENFNSLILRRRKNEPISYLTNIREFWKYEFYINESVLIPRHDSEIIIETVLKYVPNINKKYSILDLGTGSGCLIISLLKEYKNSHGLGIDIDLKALKVAKTNKSMLLNESRLMFSNDSFEKFQTKEFDIIVCNPPYIPVSQMDNIEDQVTLYEPHQSLFAEEDGLLNYKNIIKNLRKNINKDQIIFFEIGINQSSSVINLLKINNFAVISVENDLANIPRCIVAKRI